MNWWNRFLKWVDRTIVGPIEGTKLHPFWWLLIFYCAVTLRFILESIYESRHLLGGSSVLVTAIEETLFEFPLFFFVLILCLILIVHGLTRERIGRITKMFVTFSFVMALVPIFDHFFRSAGYTIYYPATVREFLDQVRYMLSLHFAQSPGVSSPGMKLELWGAVVLIGFYIILKTRTVWKIVVGFIATWSLVVAIVWLPTIFSFLTTIFHPFIKGNPGLAYTFTYKEAGFITSEPRRYAFVYFIAALVLVPLWLRFYNREKFRALWQDIRWADALAVMALFPVGLLVGWNQLKPAYYFAFQNPLDFLVIAGLVLLGLMVYQGGRLLNRFFEPTAPPHLTREDLKQLAAGFLILGLLLALCISYSAFFSTIILYIIGALSIFPPIRLKRFWPLNSIIRGTVALLAVITGFAVIGGERSFLIFPTKLGVVLMIAVTMIDQTRFRFPLARTHFDSPLALFGERWGSRLLSLLILVGYCIPPILLGYPLLYFAAVPLGLLGAIFIHIRPIKTGLLYGLHGIFLAILFFFILSRGLVLDPKLQRATEALGHYLSGEVYLLRNDNVNAALEYQTAEDLGLQDQWLYYRWGSVELYINRTESAISHLRKATNYPRLSPDPSTVLALGYALLKDDNPEGETVYRRAIELGSFPGECYHQLGVQYRRTGNLKLAAWALQNSIRLGEHRADSWRQLGDVARDELKFTVAEECYLQSLKHDPNQLTPYLHLGALYFYQDKLDTALKVYQRAVTIAPNDPVLRNNLGLVYAQLGWFQLAGEEFLNAIELKFDFLEAYDNLSLLLYQMGKLPEAVEVLQRALEVDPKHQLSLDSLITWLPRLPNRN